MVKVVPNSEKPGTFLFGASSLWALSDTHLCEHGKRGFRGFLTDIRVLECFSRGTLTELS